ncbi:MAG: 30S ribosomal protein S16 [Kiritimatiellia bacterium]
MAVKIRMKRTGAKNDACYRLVAADERSPRDGRNLEILGWYDPAAKGETFALKLDRVDYWLSVGAQISDTAASLVKKARKGAVTAEVAAPVAAAEPVVVAEVEAEAPVAEEVVADEAADA